MSTFLDMSSLWGHTSLISDRVSQSAVTDLKDLSILCDFLDGQEWAKIVNIATEIGDKVCQTQLVSTSILIYVCIQQC